MDSNLFGIDNRAVLGQLFKTAFGVAPVYMTVPIGNTKPAIIEGFSPGVNSEFVNEDVERLSIYGTPIIFPIQFQADTYKVYDCFGRIDKKEYRSLWLPATTMVDFSRSKNIIKTDVLGNSGTVKEIFGFDDWQLRIRMLCITDQYFSAAEYLEQLLDWNEVIGSININSSILNKKKIYSIILEDMDIKSIAGSPGVIPIEFSAISDEPIELLTTGV